MDKWMKGKPECRESAYSLRKQQKKHNSEPFWCMEKIGLTTRNLRILMWLHKKIFYHLKTKSNIRNGRWEQSLKTYANISIPDDEYQECKSVTWATIDNTRQRYIRSKRKMKETIGLLLTGEGELTDNTEKAELLRAYFDFAFMENVICKLWVSQVNINKEGKGCRRRQEKTQRAFDWLE